MLPNAKLWNVLIAEDDFTCCQELIKHLREAAYLTIAKDGEEALEVYEKSLKKKKPFNFLLLDVTMPNKDGFEVLNAIRRREETSGNPAHKPISVIMITAFKDSLMERYNMGWDEYITKPIDGKKLIEKMSKLFETRKTS